MFFCIINQLINKTQWNNTMAAVCGFNNHPLKGDLELLLEDRFLEELLPLVKLAKRSEDVYRHLNHMRTREAGDIGISSKEYGYSILKLKEAEFPGSKELTFAIQTSTGEFVHFSAPKDLFADDYLTSLGESYSEMSEDEKKLILTGERSEKIIDAHLEARFSGNPSPYGAAERYREKVVERYYREDDILSGYIHISTSDSVPDVKDRIYIHGNPEHLVELTKILVANFFNDSFPEVFRLKIAGPTDAERDDNLVLFLGGDRFTDHDAAVQRLRELQAKYPTYFSNEQILCKINEAPGIATIPQKLASNESFGSELSAAIFRAGKQAIEPSSIADFREKIIENFIRERKQPAFKD